MKELPIQIEDVSLSFDEKGFKVCGVVEGRRVCSPTIKYEDAERELGNALEAIEEEGKRFWRRIWRWVRRRKD